MSKYYQNKIKKTVPISKSLDRQVKSLSKRLNLSTMAFMNIATELLVKQIKNGHISNNDLIKYVISDD